MSGGPEWDETLSAFTEGVFNFSTLKGDKK